ncbi:16S rRNA (uracil(1498)-N(3))-methyltransferase [Paenibacillus gansuensis]|uniref:Ribosomal RNA small subunit methyltransferase E n=1 Tax=Paenibacillus gansuensis TaxID=306542 RepID=A0ABW5PCJ1_9BACL
MQRYFVAPEQFTDDEVRITGDDAHHLTRVMRARTGEQVICSDGQEREALVEITEILAGTVTARIIEKLPMDAEPAVEVWVAQSLPKGDKMETVIQKCTEIGASRFLPFLSERTVVQYDAKKEAKRLDRWNKIAKEASEQAHRNRVPEVTAPYSWKQLLQMAGEFDLALICYEKEQGLRFRERLRMAAAEHRLNKVLLLIGPEGGFSENEIAQAESSGVHSISLGKRILRTETAAMAALTCILYETGEMGGT